MMATLAEISQQIRDAGMAAEQKLPGGEGDELTPTDVDEEQLAKGIAVEMEHTDDEAIAREIALDHLAEDAEYYDKLEKMESEGVDTKLFSRFAARNNVVRLSTNANVHIWRASDKNWYYSIAYLIDEDDDRSDYGKPKYYGPFFTDASAKSHLLDHEGNPGSWSIDSSGTKKPPNNAKRFATNWANVPTDQLIKVISELGKAKNMAKERNEKTTEIDQHIQEAVKELQKRKTQLSREMLASPEQKSAMQKVQQREGKNWKEVIWAAWQSGKYPDYLTSEEKAQLQALRNEEGSKALRFASPEQKAILQKIKQREGRAWRDVVAKGWQTGNYPDYITDEEKRLLQVLRNEEGGSALR